MPLLYLLSTTTPYKSLRGTFLEALASLFDLIWDLILRALRDSKGACAAVIVGDGMKGGGGKAFLLREPRVERIRRMLAKMALKPEYLLQIAHTFKAILSGSNFVSCSIDTPITDMRMLNTTPMFRFLLPAKLKSGVRGMGRGVLSLSPGDPEYV